MLQSFAVARKFDCVHVLLQNIITLICQRAISCEPCVAPIHRQLFSESRFVFAIVSSLAATFSSNRWSDSKMAKVIADLKSQGIELPPMYTPDIIEKISAVIERAE